MRPSSDPVVRRFLRRSMLVRIATLSPAGNPDIIPLWFVFLRGRIYMTTRSENPTVRDLKLNPEVLLLFDGERGVRRNRVLRIRGRASFRSERHILVPVFALSALRYYLSPGGMANTLRHRRKFGVRTHYYSERAGESGVIEVVPETAEFLPSPM
jgi:uncharacterized pyridoxamine 5'-phosphate oxidase family protein